jgi:hypothetical protein
MVEGEIGVARLDNMEKTKTSRKHFKPTRITTLFVGESAPAGGTFFYDGNSSLFKAMKKALNGKETFLEDFQRSGFYLDDLVEEPVNKMEKKARRARCRESIPSLTKRLRNYKPEAIVIAMCAIKPMVLQATHDAKADCEIYCTPHPAFGNWNRFQKAMSEIIDRLPVAGGNTWKDVTP